MKIKYGSGLIVCFLFAAFSFASTAHALTYFVNRVIGAGTVTGFIQTDGTIGVLVGTNITDWALTLDFPAISGGTPINIIYAPIDPHDTYAQGPSTIASSTEITFDFDLSSVGNAFHLGPSGSAYWRLDGALSSEIMFASSCCTSWAGTDYVQRTGVVVIASVNAVPLPAALPLFGTALAGMGFIGWLRRRKAAA